MSRSMFPIPSHLPHTTVGPATIVFGHRNGKYPDGNQVLVQGADLCVAFDLPQVSRQLGAALGRVDAVILGHVHEDHVAGLSQLPRAALWVHTGDAAAVRSWDGLRDHYGYADPVWHALKDRLTARFHFSPRPDAQAYEDGMRWDLGGGVGVQAVHLPGHTRGHCALLVEPVGLAFIGDIDLSGFGPYYGDGTSNLADFRRSLRRVRDLPARQWITSHHKGLVSERSEFEALLDAFAARIDERSDKLLRMLGCGPMGMQELVARRLIYPVGHADLWVDEAERRTIAQHLAELLAARQVAEREPGVFERV